jgi:hypothetical protein
MLRDLHVLMLLDWNSALEGGNESRHIGEAAQCSEALARSTAAGGVPLSVIKQYIEQQANPVTQRALRAPLHPPSKQVGFAWALTRLQLQPSLLWVEHCGAIR